MSPERGKIYRLRSRNLIVGAYDGRGGFIGIREKFGQRYLFTEFDSSVEGWGGATVTAIEEELGQVPSDVELAESSEVGNCRHTNQRLFQLLEEFEAGLSR